MPDSRTSRPKRVKYLAADDHGQTFDYPVQALQRALTAQGMEHVHNDTAINRFLGRGLSKLGLMRQVKDLSDTAYLVPIMQITEMRLFPQCYFAEVIPYCFDCWPRKYDQWEAFFRRHRIKVAFITARQSAERMRQRIPGLDAIWMPEGIDPTRYEGSKPLAERTIDVLEMGRRLTGYHEQIRPHCQSRGYVHEYEREPGQIIFPTCRAFVAGLGESKISVCFPSSQTHAFRAGDVETLTLRYLESIASGCIVVGHCPAELHDLFGANPVVPADISNPGEQIDHILSHLVDYEPLVHRNLQRLYEVGTWRTRVSSMQRALTNHQYTV
jgi:hypothetical protein